MTPRERAAQRKRLLRYERALMAAQTSLGQALWKIQDRLRDVRTSLVVSHGVARGDFVPDSVPITVDDKSCRLLIDRRIDRALAPEITRVITSGREVKS